MGTKYKEVFTAIEKDILDGRYDATRKLNTEDAYIEEFNVSRNTIRNAIDLLIKRGYCFPIQGSGVFLRRKKPAYGYDLENINSLTNYMAPLQVTNELLDFREIPANEEMARRIEVPIGSPLYYVVRMRYVDHKPYVYETIFFNKVLMSDFNFNAAQGSIYDYLNNKMKQPITFIDLVIQVARIDLEEARNLQLVLGDPCLLVDGYSMTRTGDIIMFYTQIFHYENARLLKMASYF
jgi:GntR family transcriptional regulator of bglA